MHRHGYKGRKFHRERDQRSMLIAGLADELIQRQAIETTLPKAKELMPYVDKLITKAKQANLHSRRQIIAELPSLTAAHQLVDDIAPKLKHRTSGYLRVEKTSLRKGDNAQMARISFVDDLSKPSSPTTEPTAEAMSTVTETKSVVTKKTNLKLNLNGASKHENL
jgi:large subunit ribosomal protein L17